MSPSLSTRILSAALWPELEELFGVKGACGGCWCMFWRIAKGVKWDAIKGPIARDRFAALVESGGAQGVLAYLDGGPVG